MGPAGAAEALLQEEEAAAARPSARASFIGREREVSREAVPLRQMCVGIYAGEEPSGHRGGGMVGWLWMAAAAEDGGYVINR